MAVIVEDGRLTLTGYVGESTLEIDGWVIFDGFTHAEVVSALGEIGPDADLTVHINSGGGIATEGTAIRAALADREGRTDIVIDGIAASSASIIAMAGDSLSMSLGSLMMIHDPSGSTWGTVEDHEKSIKALNSVGNTFARVYARKSGKSDDECREIMKAESWFTPEEAVAAGFADAALEDQGAPVAAFPYQQYAHAPRELVAMAQTNGWRTPVPMAAVTAAHPNPKSAPRKETTPMAPKPTATAAPTTSEPPNASPAPAPVPIAEAASASDVKARIKAIMTSEEAQKFPTLAAHLAYDCDDPAEEAIAKLKAAAGDAPKSEDGTTPDPKAYQAKRTAAADLAPPAGGAPKAATATINTAGIYAARRGQKEA
jgi:ATP-dependent protease ClpP protease subunit